MQIDALYVVLLLVIGFISKLVYSNLRFAFPCCHLNSASVLLSNTWSRQWEWGRIVFFVMHTLLPWQLVTTLHSEYPRYTHCITCYMCSTAAGTNQTFTWNYDDGLILTSSAINSIDDSMLHITHSFTLNCQPWTVTLVSRILGHQIILLHPPTLAWRW